MILDEQVSRDLPIKNKAYEEREAWVNRKILKKMGVTLPDLNFFWWKKLIRNKFIKLQIDFC